ncbi:gamma-glutamyl-gamma-aminobutyrate hydrolase family protein [Sporosarcina soli]|uniref:Gamma-glutamyl-gamma-aminobutyrate hydrolase family protein n=1 Tax=Sporosarcina soli TaxID=334736 RepID=A0ABW0TMH7_9BACL
MKPVIGITADVDKDGKHLLNNNYVQAIIRAGGLPFIIPIGIEGDSAQVTDLIDGLLLTGGGDIDPLLFGEEPHPNLGQVIPARDVVELELTRQMMKCDKPILGICRGLQVLNVAAGGTIYQDIYKQHVQPIIQHHQKAPTSHATHYVQLKKGSFLEELAGSGRILVNSFHHQSLKDVPEPFSAVGVATDQIIEAIESAQHQFVIGVQWHPERLAENGDSVSLGIFNRFIRACNNGKS